MYKAGFLVALLPVLSAAAPQVMGTPVRAGSTASTTALTTAVAPSSTQVLALSTEDYQAISELVEQLGSLEKRGTLPNIETIIKYIPSVIIPTIFNMALDMVKDLDGSASTPSALPIAAPATNATRRDVLNDELARELERRGFSEIGESLTELGETLGTKLSGINLKPIIEWLPNLIPALIGPAFAIADGLLDHSSHSSSSTTATSSAVAAATTTAAPAYNSTVATAAAGQRRGAVEFNYESIVSEIQAMVQSSPVIVGVTSTTEMVPLSTMMSPGLTITTSQDAQATSTVA